MKDRQYRNFIIFWFSQSVSQLGSSMTSFALIIWSYGRTGSAMSVSLMTFCTWLPYIAASIAAGPVIDRYRKKTIDRGRRRLPGRNRFFEGLLPVGSADDDAYLEFSE